MGGRGSSAARPRSRRGEGSPDTAYDPFAESETAGGGGTDYDPASAGLHGQSREVLKPFWPILQQLAAAEPTAQAPLVDRLLTQLAATPVQDREPGGKLVAALAAELAPKLALALWSGARSKELSGTGLGVLFDRSCAELPGCPELHAELWRVEPGLPPRFLIYLRDRAAAAPAGAAPYMRVAAVASAGQPLLPARVLVDAERLLEESHELFYGMMPFLCSSLALVTLGRPAFVRLVVKSMGARSAPTAARESVHTLTARAQTRRRCSR